MFPLEVSPKVSNLFANLFALFALFRGESVQNRERINLLPWDGGASYSIILRVVATIPLLL